MLSHVAPSARELYSLFIISFFLFGSSINTIEMKAADEYIVV